MLQLASNQCAAKQKDIRPRRDMVPQLRVLADQLVIIIQAGRIEEAREIVRRFKLPPIAWGFLASCLQQSRIPAEIIEGVLS